MRKLFYLFIICLYNHTVYAQKEIGLSAGYTKNGYGIMVDYSRPVKESGFANIGLGSFFSIKNKGGFEIPYQTYTASLSYFLKLQQSETNNLSLGVGGISSYQRINNGNDRLDDRNIIDAKSKFIYGVAISGMFDYRLSYAFKVFALFMQKYHFFNSDIGGFSFYGGVGVRYYF